MSAYVLYESNALLWRVFAPESTHSYTSRMLSVRLGYCAILSVGSWILRHTPCRKLPKLVNRPSIYVSPLGTHAGRGALVGYVGYVHTPRSKGYCAHPSQQRALCTPLAATGIVHNPRSKGVCWVRMCTNLAARVCVRCVCAHPSPQGCLQYWITASNGCIVAWPVSLATYCLIVARVRGTVRRIPLHNGWPDCIGLVARSNLLAEKKIGFIRRPAPPPPPPLCSRLMVRPRYL